MRQLKKEWYTPFEELRREMSRLVDDFSTFRPQAFRFSRKTWEPAIDVYETDDSVVVIVEIAGLEEDDIEVMVKGNNLVIKGIRGDRSALRRRRYHQIEIRRGPFEREVSLPATVEPEQISAYYENGLLEIVMSRLLK